MSITLSVPPAIVQEVREWATAEKLGCTQILTEDLNDGQTYRGMVAVNPFKTHANTEPNALVDFSSNP